MNVGKGAGEVLLDVVTTPIEIAAQIRGKADIMEGAAKVVINGAKVAEIAGAGSASLGNVTGQLGVFTGFLSACSIFERGGFWVSLIGKEEPVSAKKVTGEVFLTAANVAETTLWLGKTGLFDLGTAAPVIEIVKSIVLIPVSVCNIWNASDEIAKAGREVEDKAAKISKWSERKKLSLLERQKYVKEKIDPLIAEIGKIAIEKKAAEKDGLSPEDEEQFKNRFAPLMKKHGRWCEIRDEDGKFDKLCDFKIENHGQILAIAEHNKGKVQTKNWLVLANSLMKLALGVLGLVMVLASITVIWVLALVAALWTATHIVGLAKELYDLRPVNKQLEFPVVETKMMAANLS